MGGSLIYRSVVRRTIKDFPRRSGVRRLVDTQAVRLAPFVRINHGWQPTKDRQAGHEWRGYSIGPRSKCGDGNIRRSTNLRRSSPRRKLRERGFWKGTARPARGIPSFQSTACPTGESAFPDERDFAEKCGVGRNGTGFFVETHSFPLECRGEEHHATRDLQEFPPQEVHPSEATRRDLRSIAPVRDRAWRAGSRGRGR